MTLRVEDNSRSSTLPEMVDLTIPIPNAPGSQHSHEQP